MPEDPAYILSISLETLKHLGIGLYSNVPAVLSEVVANSYDADADWVRLDIDRQAKTITVSDNGWGMSQNELNNKYLNVGYSKRIYEPQITPKGRLPMGRKGIGKLALFAIANEIELHSVKRHENGNVEKSGFIMATQDIENAIKNKKAYNPVPIDGSAISITEGTSIILRQLKRNIDASEVFLRKRLARRFSIIGEENGFAVIVNGKPIDITDRDYFSQLEYIWYFGKDGKKYSDICSTCSHSHQLDEIVDKAADYRVEGWIGTFKEQKQIEEGNNTISILARGKLIHEDLLKDIKEAGVYAQYLIGEVRADFLDDDSDEDIATSDRQSLREDDPRYTLLKQFIQTKALKTIQSKWSDFRKRDAKKKALSMPAVNEWFEGLGRDNKKYAEMLFERIESFPIEDIEYKRELYRHGILAFETLALQQNLNLLETVTSESDMDRFKAIIEGIDEIEQVQYYQILRGRLGVLQKLTDLASPQIKERLIHDHIYEHLWLLDPTWERAQFGERYEQTLGKEFDVAAANLSPEELDARLDIRYTTATGKHVVIELKKYDRPVSFMELIQQTDKYYRALNKCLLKHYPNDSNVIEIICLVGPKPQPREDELRYVEMLKQARARYLTYDELIIQTEQSYKDYLEAHRNDISRIMKLINRI